MTDFATSIEGFLSRWSRRKRGPKRCPDVAAADNPPAFDPASLPSIESIQAANDVRAFLAPGVPLNLARTALRRAWVTDPTIRDFIGIADNQWDFTKPDSIAGFGPLDITPDLQRLISDLLGEDPQRGPAPQHDSQTDSASENHDPIEPPQAYKSASAALTKPEDPTG